MGEELTVSSEIYKETNFDPIKCDNGRILSSFKFYYPPNKTASVKDNDGDWDVIRKTEGIIEIEHSGSTVLQLVGLQVWRGALLLADFLFHSRFEISDKNILELGAGVGLTSIAAAIYANLVVCTDVDIGGILNLIRTNVKNNRKLTKTDVQVVELDFKADQFPKDTEKLVDDTDIVIAADVIYDDDLTDCFIGVLDKLLDKNKYKKSKIIYIALEKRYVFTITDLDSCPPCYDYFLQKTSKKSWKIENIPIDFPQFFQYKRCKQLVLLKVTNK